MTLNTSLYNDVEAKRSNFRDADGNEEALPVGNLTLLTRDFDERNKNGEYILQKPNHRHIRP
jgi:hypothetical protein